jgi:hypothetical protein
MAGAPYWRMKPTAVDRLSPDAVKCLSALLRKAGTIPDAGPRYDPPEPVADARPIGYINRNAPVAQLDRALPSEGKGHTFESCRVRHSTILHDFTFCISQSPAEKSARGI